MKTEAMLALGVVLICLNAYAQENDCRTVTVYVTGEGFTDSSLPRAQEIASGMFAVAGVRVNWRKDSPSASEDGCGAILMRLTTGQQVPHHPEAMAYALPYANEGTVISVMWDQVRKVGGKSIRFRDALLAHVLVHEITHVLQAVARHSTSGVMRRYWTESDYLEMRNKPLPFTAEDIQLIRGGLEKRNQRVKESLLAVRSPER